MPLVGDNASEDEGRTANRKRRTENGGRKTEDGKRRTENGGRKTEDIAYIDTDRGNMRH